jgi:hypothetical protein
MAASAAPRSTASAVKPGRRVAHARPFVQRNGAGDLRSGGVLADVCHSPVAAEKRTSIHVGEIAIAAPVAQMVVAVRSGHCSIVDTTCWCAETPTARQPRPKLHMWASKCGHGCTRTGVPRPSAGMKQHAATWLQLSGRQRWQRRGRCFVLRM